MRIAIDKNCRLVSKRIPQSFRDQTINFKDDNKWFYEEGVNVNCNFVLPMSYNFIKLSRNYCQKY